MVISTRVYRKCNVTKLVYYREQGKHMASGFTFNNYAAATILHAFCLAVTKGGGLYLQRLTWVMNWFTHHEKYLCPWCQGTEEQIDFFRLAEFLLKKPMYNKERCVPQVSSRLAKKHTVVFSSCCFEIVRHHKISTTKYNKQECNPICWFSHFFPIMKNWYIAHLGHHTEEK